MTEYTAKKLGEVLAFARLGTDTITKGSDALSHALPSERIVDMQEKYSMHETSILHITTTAGVNERMLAKAGKTEEKLRTMRDLYIGDNWDNATEIMEWTGFFAGAAIVHWALVRGAAQALQHEELLMLSEECINWYYELLELAESETEAKGQSSAMAETV